MGIVETRTIGRSRGCKIILQRRHERRQGNVLTRLGWIDKHKPRNVIRIKTRKFGDDKSTVRATNQHEWRLFASAGQQL
ncbi:MAG: hypothetical protein M0D54_20155 [Hyphomonadaceae bacterium JAD_PAG50586_4]|nr:MAG: hypothetical protein M0D54_20155 [Hyphomonadaceae bacterium JAD_PAG50586_4]